ncbi:MAG TPA: hypothetical protein VGM90_14405 [Kofleriaceae bacterium]
MAPIATIASRTSSLTVALFDASTASDWVPSKAAANKAQFTGHPAEILRGLAKGEDIAAIDVGASSGVAFELEGKSGRIEVYRVDDSTIALVAPPRSWWQQPAAEVDALFAEALAPDEGDETDLEVPSGKLAIVYMWLDDVGAAVSGKSDGCAVIEVGAGTHRLHKREIESPWDQPLVVMYIARA